MAVHLKPVPSLITSSRTTFLLTEKNREITNVLLDSNKCQKNIQISEEFLMNFNEMHILALKVTWSIDFDECCCVTKYTSNSKAWVDQLVPSPALLSSKVAVSTREKLQSDNAAHFFVFTPSTARSRCCPPQIPWKSADDSL